MLHQSQPNEVRVQTELEKKRKERVSDGDSSDLSHKRMHVPQEGRNPINSVVEAVDQSHQEP